MSPKSAATAVGKPADPPSEARPTLLRQMQRGDLFAELCPSREVLQHVTSRWGVLVLVALLSGTYRFSDLRRKIRGVSEKMLAQTLQWLEADGFVLRVAHPVIPPHVDYSLTPLGQEVGLRVQELADWIETSLPSILQARGERQAAMQAASSLTAGVVTHRLT